MSLIYSTSEKIFIKQNYKKHSGMPACYPESPAEAFYVNQFITDEIYNSEFFAYDTPSYYTFGGTLNYYAQDFWSIFTNVYRPLIKFIFTANTTNFGTGTTIKHQVYKIPYDIYSKYISEEIRQGIEQNKDSSEETIEETITESGITKTIVTTRKKNILNTIEKFAPEKFPETISGYGIETVDKYSKIKELLTNPILTITASTSGISTSVYDLFLDGYQKNLGIFKYQLFEDYAQYFITTQFEMVHEQSTRLKDFCNLDESGNIVPVNYEQYITETTPVYSHVITGGTFSGVTVYGNYFTYFLLPNKPKWTSPYVSGQLATFSPTFFWTNANDADSFLFQVVYDSGDCQSFSGVVYSYPVNVEDTKLSTDEMLNRDSEPWAITQKTVDVVREYSIPLLSNKTFWYRVGNVKEMINIFGVKQSVVTFSDIMSAATTGGYNSYVYVNSDSPHTEEISDWTYPTYLDDTLQGQYSLSGVVSGSVVTGATIQLVYPNSSYITQPTDSTGNFVFTELEPGTYTLNTSYRGYAQDSRSINITGNTDIGVIQLKLIWGNAWDTWGSKANEIYPF